MQSIRISLIIMFAALMISGCAPKTRYVWDNYDNKLYKHYKNPAEYDQFLADLKATIDSGEEEGRVPPGLYAEYGFALYEKGNYPEAILFFQKEAEKWPESRALMTKMVKNAQMRAQKGAKVAPPVDSDAVEVNTSK